MSDPSPGGQGDVISVGWTSEVGVQQVVLAFGTLQEEAGHWLVHPPDPRAGRIPFKEPEWRQQPMRTLYWRYFHNGARCTSQTQVREVQRCLYSYSLGVFFVVLSFHGSLCCMLEV